MELFRTPDTKYTVRVINSFIIQHTYLHIHRHVDSNSNYVIVYITLNFSALSDHEFCDLNFNTTT